MNRITDRLPDGAAYVRSETGEEGTGAFTTQRGLPEIISKLAEYEDTGLEPRMVQLIKNCIAEVSEEYNSLFDYVAKTFTTYAKAEEEGRLLELPCPVGSTVYITHMKYRQGREIWYVNTGRFCLADMDKLGNTVFLTREEAEKAVAGRRKHGN